MDTTYRADYLAYRQGREYLASHTKPDLKNLTTDTDKANALAYWDAESAVGYWERNAADYAKITRALIEKGRTSARLRNTACIVHRLEGGQIMITHHDEIIGGTDENGYPIIIGGAEYRYYITYNNLGWSATTARYMREAYSILAVFSPWEPRALSPQDLAAVFGRTASSNWYEVKRTKSGRLIR